MTSRQRRAAIAAEAEKSIERMHDIEDEVSAAVEQRHAEEDAARLAENAMLDAIDAAVHQRLFAEPPGAHMPAAQLWRRGGQPLS